ncbi:MAG TPA: trypsin-like peptidase domain-containing protein [Candidatus Polarisedimenticolaceae bacterium]
MRPIRVLLCLLLLAPAARAQTVAEVYKRVRDSVVTVRTLERGPAKSAAGATAFLGLGSGVIIDASGWALTAAHVVQTAEAVAVELASGEEIEARVVASEPLVDLALLKLERVPAKLVAAKSGDSSLVEIGEQVFVVGAPLGISQSLSVGHVSGKREANALFGGFESAELIQTDAAINTGNSGGPMFNMKGEVVGIVSSILSRSGGFEGIGFAISSNTARRLLTERPPWTGLEGIMVAGELAALLNFPQPVGLLVQRVASGSPAAAMGIRGGSVEATIEDEKILLGGDVILEVAGVKLSETGAGAKIRTLISGRTRGERISVVVLRGGGRVELIYTVP